VPSQAGEVRFKRSLWRLPIRLRSLTFFVLPSKILQKGEKGERGLSVLNFAVGYHGKIPLVLATRKRAVGETRKPAFFQSVSARMVRGKFKGEM